MEGIELELWLTIFYIGVVIFAINGHEKRITKLENKKDVEK